MLSLRSCFSPLSIIPFAGFALSLLFVLSSCSWNKSFIKSFCLSANEDGRFDGRLNKAEEIELGQNPHLIERAREREREKERRNEQGREI